MGLSYEQDKTRENKSLKIEAVGSKKLIHDRRTVYQQDSDFDASSYSINLLMPKTNGNSNNSGERTRVDTTTVDKKKLMHHAKTVDI